MDEISYYQIVVSSSDLELICDRYLEERNRKISSRRAEMIADAMKKTKGFWFFKKPKFNSEEEATDYLKSHYTGCSYITDWDSAEIRGSRWAKIIVDLKDVIYRNPSQKEFRLHSELSFLLTYLG